ncbi:MAG: hypothetical protein HUU02_03175 [Bacteroidetes bacterium]|nr:hypothetical protein [Bacteroidota bacterium]
MSLRIPLLLILLPVLVLTQEQEGKRYYFYRPENRAFGSESQVGPATVFLNGAYDMLRNGGHSKDILRWPYAGGAVHVWKNIRDPFATISTFGWNEFVHQEIFNFTIGVKNAEFVPNIAGHTIGNGMIYAKLAEYFDHSGYPLPYLWSGLTTTAYQVMNEIIEAEYYRGINVDLVADIYIFNLAGIGIFSTEWGQQFFSETLPIGEWSPQPMFEPRTGFLQNAGQQNYVRKRFRALGRWSPFLYYGVYNLFGASYALDDEHSITVSAGRVVNKLKDGRLRGFRKIDPQLDGSAGLFWDRNGSLMTSLLLTGPGLYNMQLNVYPGVFEFGGVSPGIYLAVGEWDGFIAGITFSSYFPLGIGYGQQR